VFLLQLLRVGVFSGKELFLSLITHVRGIMHIKIVTEGKHEGANMPLDPEVRTDMRCPRCGLAVTVWYSNKTGDPLAWTCTCGIRGYFQGPDQKPVILNLA
jgi:hypothetical protein